MSSQMAEAIRQLQDNGYTKEQVLTTIESMLKAAYKRTFGTNVKNVCTPYYDTYTPYVINYYSDYLQLKHAFVEFCLTQFGINV